MHLLQFLSRLDSLQGHCHSKPSFTLNLLQLGIRVKVASCLLLELLLMLLNLINSGLGLPLLIVGLWFFPECINELSMLLLKVLLGVCKHLIQLLFLLLILWIVKCPFQSGYLGLSISNITLHLLDQFLGVLILLLSNRLLLDGIKLRVRLEIIDGFIVLLLLHSMLCILDHGIGSRLFERVLVLL